MPGARDGTGLCGGVGCARGDCWPRYVRSWNPLVKVTDGPVAVALWFGPFRRDPARWIEAALPLFQRAARGRDPAPDCPWVDKETGSRWSVLGRAVPARGRGELRWLPGVMVKWYAWAAKYPKTSIEKAERRLEIATPSSGLSLFSCP